MFDLRNNQEALIKVTNVTDIFKQGEIVSTEEGLIENDRYNAIKTEGLPVLC